MPTPALFTPNFWPEVIPARCIMTTCSLTRPTTPTNTLAFRRGRSPIPERALCKRRYIPAKSDYYYFVADAAGHHRFARTIEEHNQNVIAYRRAMRGK